MKEVVIIKNSISDWDYGYGDIIELYIIRALYYRLAGVHYYLYMGMYSHKPAIKGFLSKIKDSNKQVPVAIKEVFHNMDAMVPNDIITHIIGMRNIVYMDIYESLEAKDHALNEDELEEESNKILTFFRNIDREDPRLISAVKIFKNSILDVIAIPDIAYEIKTESDSEGRILEYISEVHREWRPNR